MEVLYTPESGPWLNTVEEFYIYKGTENDKQLNDKHTVLSNSIFSVITQQEYYDWLPLHLSPLSTAFVCVLYTHLLVIYKTTFFHKDM
jgi:hypothetical protein